MGGQPTKHNPINDGLARYVRGTAHNIAYRRNCTEDVEDVEQDLILALLELYVEDPDAFSLPKKDLVAQVANKVDWQYRKTQIHARRIAIEDRPVDPADPDSPALTEFTGENPWSEIELSFATRQALATLDARDRQIAHGLAQGYSVREIGSMIDCPPRTVYYRMRGPIAQALSI